MTVKVQAIPEPRGDLPSLLRAAQATKAAVEIIAGTRGTQLNAAVTWQDLVDLRLITVAQVPK